MTTEKIDFNVFGTITINVSDKILATSEDEAIDKFNKRLIKKYKLPNYMDDDSYEMDLMID